MKNVRQYRIIRSDIKPPLSTSNRAIKADEADCLRAAAAHVAEICFDNMVGFP